MTWTEHNGTFLSGAYVVSPHVAATGGLYYLCWWRGQPLYQRDTAEQAREVAREHARGRQ